MRVCILRCSVLQYMQHNHRPMHIVIPTIYLLFLPKSTTTGCKFGNYNLSMDEKLAILIARKTSSSTHFGNHLNKRTEIIIKCRHGYNRAKKKVMRCRLVQLPPYSPEDRFSVKPKEIRCVHIFVLMLYHYIMFNVKW